MSRTILIIVEAGEKTCTTTDGKPCHHMVTHHFGTKWTCGVFGTELVNDKGWLQRAQECLDSDFNPSTIMEGCC